MIVKKAALAVTAATLLLSTDMVAYAATDVGEVSRFECDEIPYAVFKTTYSGKISKNTPVKRIAQENRYDYDYDNNSGDVYKTTFKYKYDAKGNVVKKYSDSVVGKYKYDKNGHLIDVSGTGASDTDFEVDSDGRIVREIYTNKDGEYGHTDYIYKNGKVIKEVSTFIFNGGTKTTKKYKYNKKGNLVKYGNTTFRYDKYGKLISAHVDRGNSYPFDYQFFYDNDGYLSKIEHAFGDGEKTDVEFVYQTVAVNRKGKNKGK